MKYNKFLALAFALLCFFTQPVTAQVQITRPNTYAATVAPFAVVATPTDVVVITGSATRRVRIVSIRLWGTQTVAGTARVSVIKRSTADTAGTAVSATPVAVDSNNIVAATATVAAYTANPTVGTAVANVYDAIKLIPAPGTAAAMDSVVYDTPWTGNATPIILNNANECLAINLQGVTLTGGSLSATIYFTEE